MERAVVENRGFHRTGTNHSSGQKSCTGVQPVYVLSEGGGQRPGQRGHCLPHAGRQHTDKKTRKICAGISGRKIPDFPDQSESRRTGTKPDRSQLRNPSGSVVEPGHRTTGHRPGLPHRTAAESHGLPPDQRTDHRGKDSTPASEQTRPG